jgi:hypothetical protein
MLKIITAGLYKLGQSFLDEIGDVDWGDNAPPDRGRISPHGPQGVIDEGNFEQYEPTEIEEPIEQRTEFGVPLEESPYQREIPTGNELLGIPEGTKEVEYDNSQQLVYDGIDRDEVISFDYTNRHGRYAGTRTVEPHYTFMARTTGNEVLVTFDRDQNDIRAFIVGNIHPYGVRYEDVLFDPRGEIMKGIY